MKCHGENEASRLVTELPLLFKETSFEVKEKWSVALFQNESIALNLTCNEKKL